MTTTASTTSTATAARGSVAVFEDAEVEGFVWNKPTTGCKSEGGCSSTDYDVYYLAYRLFWY